MTKHKMNTRKKIVSRNNPVLTQVSTDSPLSVGNGNFCFTADITGLQTLYGTYVADNFPLCTMANWGWHTAPTADGGEYTWDDLQLTEYTHAGRRVKYPTKPQPGNEEVYHWLRHNPHKFNLARIGLCRLNGSEISRKEITEINQELHLYDGVLFSSFVIDGETVEVETICDPDSNTVAFNIVTWHKNLAVKIDFPYGNHDISGSCWNSPHKHKTNWVVTSASRVMDNTAYTVDITSTASDYVFQKTGQHGLVIMPSTENRDIIMSVTFNKAINAKIDYTFDSVYKRTLNHWHTFWKKVKLIDFAKALDPRAKLLEQRMVKSLYLLAIQSIGNLPPAETGLTVNSWYGRFHTEMFYWNLGWATHWNLDYVTPLLASWICDIQDEAFSIARKNGYEGMRLPKQPANTGRDAPSEIAPLLIWQQPHIIIMLWELFLKTDDDRVIDLYWEIARDIGMFIDSFITYNQTTNEFELFPPIMPAQESFDPTTVRNPLFEVEYFRYCMSILNLWERRVNRKSGRSGLTHCDWLYISERLVKPKPVNQLYLSHDNAPDTFTIYNKDHLMMLAAMTFSVPGIIDKEIMANTLDQVEKCWQHETMWGWDYAVMSMCATDLGQHQRAIDLLLYDAPKNQYAESGNNYQRGRTDLPLYLPGNGSFLRALIHMAKHLPSEWQVEVL